MPKDTFDVDNHKDALLSQESKEGESNTISDQSIADAFGDTSDLSVRKIWINGSHIWPATLYFIDGMVDSASINESILKPLTLGNQLTGTRDESDLLEKLYQGGIYNASMQIRDQLDDVLSDMISGSVALILPHINKALTIEVKGFATRSIQEPTDESVMRGSRSSFVESLRANTAQVRRKIATPDLRFEGFKIGGRTGTNINLCYINGLTNPRIISSIKKHLTELDVDGILAPAIIEEKLTHKNYLAFPQTLITERPDRFSSFILEGRVGILIDELPTAIIIPGTLNTFMRTPEDYSNNFVFASFTGLLRYLALFITLLLPALYIAVTTFHQEMLPTQLAISIIKSKQGVPFPSYAEVFILLIAFDLLLEAGLQMPKNVGSAVSIVGGLIVGQAAVEAKIVSPTVVIVIAATLTAGFVIPNQDFLNAIRIWRILFVISATILGLTGITLLLIALFFLLCDLKVYSVPYLEPFTSQRQQYIFIDGLTRGLMDKRKNRPNVLKPLDRRRRT